MTDQILCATCGEPVSYSGRGRRPVTHPGSCAAIRRNDVDEARREARYREVLADAAVRAPLPAPELVAADPDDEEAGMMTRLRRAGFRPLWDDADEGGPVHERSRSQHRRAVLASIGPRFAEERRKTMPGKGFERDHDVADCFGCPAFDYLAVAHEFTTASLFQARQDEADDARLRGKLAERPF